MLHDKKLRRRLAAVRRVKRAKNLSMGRACPACDLVVHSVCLLLVWVILSLTSMAPTTRNTQLLSLFCGFLTDEARGCTGPSTVQPDVDPDAARRALLSSRRVCPARENLVVSWRRVSARHTSRLALLPSAANAIAAAHRSWRRRKSYRKQSYMPATTYHGGILSCCIPAIANVEGAIGRLKRLQWVAHLK